MDARMMMQMMGQARPQPAPGEDWNVEFYRNEREAQPDGVLISFMHDNWRDSFDVLEFHHGFIQWLFPVFETAGMNFESMALTKEGAAQIRADEVMSRRVIESYRLMLRFYGLRLADERTGRLEREEANFAERIHNLNTSAHNWLRVSRIITSLGELGFQRYKRPLLDALRAEVEAGTLANARRSLEDFWAPLVEEESSESYRRKTLEDEADRADGCLFLLGGALADGPQADNAEQAVSRRSVGADAGAV